MLRSAGLAATAGLAGLVAAAGSAGARGGCSAAASCGEAGFGAGAAVSRGADGSGVGSATATFEVGALGAGLGRGRIGADSAGVGVGTAVAGVARLAVRIDSDGRFLRSVRDAVLAGDEVRAATAGDSPTSIQGDGAERERRFGSFFAIVAGTVSMSTQGELAAGREADGVARRGISSDWCLLAFAAGFAAARRACFGSLPP